ncbi:MAG TPA: type II toxin-antitoxin system VapC family toxin [Mycobacterium sp.]|nr:type II toxin-antitoxin system VapC family toxin [Mycobacterium sp.]
MTISHLVDSDWTIDYLNDRPRAVSELNPLMDAGVLGMSIIVVGEVLEGFVGSPVAIAQYERFLWGSLIVQLDREAASLYADLRSQLRAAGQLLSDNASGSRPRRCATT